MNRSNLIQNQDKTHPTNELEVLFIRGLPYFSPKTAKNIALLLDNGETAVKIKRSLKASDANILSLINGFIDYYTENTVRARELLLPYSQTDY